MKHYLAIDPGKTTGYAFFSATGDLTYNSKIRGEDEFLDFLESAVAEREIKQIILERYRVRTGGKNKFTNSFSDVPTLQLIGAIQRIAKKAGIPVQLQDPSPALTIGLKFLGVESMYKGKHVPDDISALAHGTYFLRKAGITSGS